LLTYPLLQFLPNETPSVQVSDTTMIIRNTTACQQNIL
jgi:hypothetical protein